MINFNNENVSYELLIRNNTIITNLKQYEPSQTFKEAIPVILIINEIFNISKRVCKLCYFYSYVYAICIFLNSKIKHI